MIEVMRFNAPACAADYAHLAPIVFDNTPAGSDALVADWFIERLARLCLDLGIPPRLRDADIPAGDLPMLAADAMKQTRLLVNNPRAVDQAAALAIYQRAH